MSTNQIDRTVIETQLVEQLGAWDSLRALFAGGSAATGRVDDLSDVDLVAIVTPGQVEAAFDRAEEALDALGGITHRYEIPQPAWHGMHQRFYQVAGAPETAMVDLCVTEVDRFDTSWLEPSRHGTAIVHVDRDDLLVAASFDLDAHREQLRRRLADVRARIPMFTHMIGKALARGQRLDALATYRTLLLDPLVTLLNMHHRPMTFDFGIRYLHEVLSEPELERLERLSFIGSADALPAAVDEARAWCATLLDTLDADDIELTCGAARDA